MLLCMSIVRAPFTHKFEDWFTHHTYTHSEFELYTCSFGASLHVQQQWKYIALMNLIWHISQNHLPTWEVGHSWQWAQFRISVVKHVRVLLVVFVISFLIASLLSHWTWYLIFKYFITTWCSLIQMYEPTVNLIKQFHTCTWGKLDEGHATWGNAHLMLHELLRPCMREP